MTMTRKGLHRLTLLAATGGWAWVGFSFFMGVGQGVSGCLFKALTGLPCPACGSTRSLLALLRGDWAGALALNPIGLVLLAVMTALPLWTAVDMWRGTSSYYLLYNKGEQLLRRPWVFALFAAVVLANWIWNITKGL